MVQDLKDIRCKLEEVEKFLKIIHPDGPYTVSALWPKGIEGHPKGMPNIITRTFSSENLEKCLEFVQIGNDKGWNMYVLINTAEGMPAKKSNKEDIKEINWIFVDVDPYAGENLEKERERILKKLTSQLPDGIPEPTLIVDSGSGYWAFWKLEQSIKL